MDMDTECIISHMECGEILAIICECGGTSWSVHPYGVSHCTLHNIHMDTNMDMDTECIISHMECGEILQSIISI